MKNFESKQNTNLNSNSLLTFEHLDLFTCFLFYAVTPKSRFKTTFPKPSAAAEMSLPHRGQAEPCSHSLLSVCFCEGNVWVYAPSAGWLQTGNQAKRPQSLAWTGPCQLWSCREDEWIPFSQHYWDPHCAPSVALERGHNLLLSALIVPSVDAETAGLGFGAACWILPPPYCH